MKNEDLQEDRFRISVSLEQYFSDERARCFISVSARRRVQWLRRRLRRLFALPREFALLTRGHLLPLDEPLSLLAPDDRVDVIPVQKETLVDCSLSTLSSCSTNCPEEKKKKGTKRHREYSTCAENEIRHTTLPEPPARESIDTDMDANDAAAQELCEMKQRALALLDISAIVAKLDGNAASRDDHAAPLNSHAVTLDGHAVTLDGHAATLDGHAAPLEDHAAPRRRRRRVRRRRAPAERGSGHSAGGEEEAAAEAVTEVAAGGEAEAEAVAEVAAEGEAEAAAGGAVTRNGGGTETGRAPRLVRALELPHTVDCAT